MNPLLIGPLLELGKSIIAKVWPDPTQQAEAQLNLLKMQQAGEFKDLDVQLQLALAQMDINKEDAKGNWFQAGWRPNIGWICGFGLAYQVLLRPLLNGLMVALGHAAAFPEVDINTLMALVSALLGLGGFRTVEKLKGVA